MGSARQRPLTEQRHNAFTCSPHTAICDCPPDTEQVTWHCNPYWVFGFCPTKGEGEVCTADYSPRPPNRRAAVNA